MKRNIIIALVVLFTSLSFGQSSLNDYKYVIVPNQFNFLKEADQYQLNSLSKFLFNKYGFKAYLSNETFPDAVLENPCLALKANVLEKKTMFKTKLIVELRNCKGDIIYKTSEGESRRKEYEKSYNEALRDAFKSFNTVNYKYVENKNVFPTIKSTIENEDDKNEIEQLKQEIEDLKKDKNEASKTIEKPKKIVPALKPKLDGKVKNQLYAQGIDGGFQLVDKTPKVLYTIYYSGQEAIFIVKGKDAVIYKDNGVWAISEYKNGKMEVKALNIKF